MIDNSLQLFIPAEIGFRIAALGIVGQQRRMTQEDVPPCIAGIQMVFQPLELCAVLEFKATPMPYAIQANDLAFSRAHRISAAVVQKVLVIKYQNLSFWSVFSMLSHSVAISS